MTKMLILPMAGLLVSLGAALAAGTDAVADDATLAVVAKLDPGNTNPPMPSAAAPESRAIAELPADRDRTMRDARTSQVEQWWIEYGQTLGRAE